MHNFESEDEYLIEAHEELNRIEHIIYVSLKYTRTTDVLRNALLRFISYSDIILELLARKAVDSGHIDRFPRTPMIIAKRLEDYPDPEIQRFVHFYQKIRLLLRTEHNSVNEYRRHVGMFYSLPKSCALVNIDSLESLEKFAIHMYRYTRSLCGYTED